MVRTCVYVALYSVCQHTPRKFILVCQSSAKGINPSNRKQGSIELTLADLAPLARAAVSWSPPNSTGWIAALGIWITSPSVVV